MDKPKDFSDAYFASPYELLRTTDTPFVVGADWAKPTVNSMTLLTVIPVFNDAQQGAHFNPEEG